jgi:hypothetical protein
VAPWPEAPQMPLGPPTALVHEEAGGKPSRLGGIVVRSHTVTPFMWHRKQAWFAASDPAWSLATATDAALRIRCGRIRSADAHTSIRSVSLCNNRVFC